MIIAYALCYLHILMYYDDALHPHIFDFIQHHKL